MRIKRLLRRWGLIKSTKAYFREALATPGLGVRDALHGYLYGRWPYLWIGFGTGEHYLLRVLRPVIPVLNFLFQFMLRFPSDKPQFSAEGLKPGKMHGLEYSREATFADTYHAKIIRLDSAKKLVSLNKEVQLNNLEHVIPYSLARDLAIKNPSRILLLDCPCRVSRSNPCLPVDVCLIMGEPFVSFVAEHHPKKSRLIDKDEAIDVLTVEAERGHVHHAFFKEAVYGGFFAICNCCSCCCGAMQAQRNGIPMLASSGFISVIDRSNCDGCETCEKYCQFNAIVMHDSKAVVNFEGCMGCGVCASICQQNAITLQRDFNQSAPLDLDELINEEVHCIGDKVDAFVNSPQPVTVRDPCIHNTPVSQPRRQFS